MSAPVTELATTPEDSVISVLALFPDVSAFARLPQLSEIQLTSTVYGLQ